MVAGVVVELRHVARPVESMLVLPGADVDHVPTVSGVSGQLPLTLETVANCTWSSGGGALWSEMALKGVTMAVMKQLLRAVEPPQPIPKTPRKITSKNKTEVFIATRWSSS